MLREIGKSLKSFMLDEDGASVLEVVLLLVAVSLVLIFKTEITDLVNAIFKKVSTNAQKV